MMALTFGEYFLHFSLLFSPGFYTVLFTMKMILFIKKNIWKIKVERRKENSMLVQCFILHHCFLREKGKPLGVFCNRLCLGPREQLLKCF